MNPETYNESVIDDLGENLHQCAAVPPILQEQFNKVSASELFHYSLGLITGHPGNEGPSTRLLDGTPPTQAELSPAFWRGVIDACATFRMFDRKQGEDTYRYPSMRLVAPPLLIDRLSVFVRPYLPTLAERLQSILNPETVYEQALDRLDIRIDGTDVQDLLHLLYADATLGVHHGIAGEIAQWRPRKVSMFGASMNVP